MIAKNSTVEPDELIFITMIVEEILCVKTVSFYYYPFIIPPFISKN